MDLSKTPTQRLVIQEKIRHQTLLNLHVANQSATSMLAQA